MNDFNFRKAKPNVHYSKQILDLKRFPVYPLSTNEFFMKDYRDETEQNKKLKTNKKGKKVDNTKAPFDTIGKNEKNENIKSKEYENNHTENIEILKEDNIENSKNITPQTTKLINEHEIPITVIQSPYPSQSYRAKKTKQFLENSLMKEKEQSMKEKSFKETSELFSHKDRTDDNYQTENDNSQLILAMMENEIESLATYIETQLKNLIEFLKGLTQSSNNIYTQMTQIEKINQESPVIKAALILNEKEAFSNANKLRMLVRDAAQSDFVFVGELQTIKKEQKSSKNCVVKFNNVHKSLHQMIENTFQHCIDLAQLNIFLYTNWPDFSSNNNELSQYQQSILITFLEKKKQEVDKINTMFYSCVKTRFEIERNIILLSQYHQQLRNKDQSRKNIINNQNTNDSITKKDEEVPEFNSSNVYPYYSVLNVLNNDIDINVLDIDVINQLKVFFTSSLTKYKNIINELNKLQQNFDQFKKTNEITVKLPNKITNTSSNVNTLLKTKPFIEDQNTFVQVTDIFNQTPINENKQMNKPDKGNDVLDLLLSYDNDDNQDSKRNESMEEQDEISKLLATANNYKQESYMKLDYTGKVNESYEKNEDSDLYNEKIKRNDEDEKKKRIEENIMKNNQSKLIYSYVKMHLNDCYNLKYQINDLSATIVELCPQIVSLLENTQKWCENTKYQYYLFSVLGVGGFSTVHHAIYLPEMKECALKTSHFDFSDNNDEMPRKKWNLCVREALIHYALSNFDAQSDKYNGLLHVIGDPIFLSTKTIDGIDYCVKNHWEEIIGCIRSNFMDDDKEIDKHTLSLTILRYIDKIIKFVPSECNEISIALDLCSEGSLYDYITAATKASAFGKSISVDSIYQLKKQILSAVDENLENCINNVANSIQTKSTYPIKVKDLVIIMLQIVEGIKTMHGSGVIHNDISLKNILCKSTMSGCFKHTEWVLTDLTLAKPLSKGKKIENETINNTEGNNKVVKLSELQSTHKNFTKVTTFAMTLPFSAPEKLGFVFRQLGKQTPISINNQQNILTGSRSNRVLGKFTSELSDDKLEEETNHSSIKSNEQINQQPTESEKKVSENCDENKKALPLIMPKEENKTSKPTYRLQCGEALYGLASDIFSLGVVMFICLSGNINLFVEKRYEMIIDKFSSSNTQTQFKETDTIGKSRAAQPHIKSNTYVGAEFYRNLPSIVEDYFFGKNSNSNRFICEPTKEIVSLISEMLCPDLNRRPDIFMIERRLIDVLNKKDCESYEFSFM